VDRVWGIGAAGIGSTSRRRRLVVAAAGLLLIVGGAVSVMHVGLTGLWPHNRATTLPDSQLVYCLDLQRTPALGRAAVSLGLAEGTVAPDRIVAASVGQPAPRSTDMTIAEWRRAHPDDFHRACTALVKAAPAGQAPAPAAPESNPGSRWLGVAYSSLLPLLTGALVARLTLNRQRRGDLADQLQTAHQAFTDAVTKCLDHPRDSAADAAMTQHRQTLNSLLARAARLRPRRPLDPALAQLQANQGPLGESFLRTPIGGPPAEADHRQVVSLTVRKVEQAVTSLARELDTPRWRFGGRA
jgi:hypothetical protein